MLKTGDAAPGFELADADMEMVRLSSFKGKNVVMYFYPRDDTPGCTMEAIEFSELEDDFTRLHTVVLGVSRDDCISHASFRDKHGLTVRLLSDSEGTVCKKYGVWQQKEKDGIKKMGVVRSTFVIDSKGVLRHVEYGVNARGHAAQIMELVKSLK
ncbi:MAG: peroxiredoxin [Burkholderiales bacterium]